MKATIDEARQAVWNLRHASGKSSSIPALFQLARKLAGEHDMQIETETAGTSVRLDEMTDRTLLLVGREALRNAVSHGQAQRITVRLIFSDTEVRLEVEDDGTGSAVAPYRHDREGNVHFGIIGMRERVEQVGGRLAVESEPGRGTLVAARVPRQLR